MRTAGVPMGSRCVSYWFMRGDSVAQVAPVPAHPDAGHERPAVRLGHVLRPHEGERVGAQLEALRPALSWTSLETPMVLLTAIATITRTAPAWTT